MRAPRDLDHYATARATAVWLRKLADGIERNEYEYPLVKVNVQISNWNPEWQKRVTITRK